jgi:hypothetical protein
MSTEKKSEKQESHVEKIKKCAKFFTSRLAGKINWIQLFPSLGRLGAFAAPAGLGVR